MRNSFPLTSALLVAVCLVFPISGALAGTVSSGIIAPAESQSATTTVSFPAAQLHLEQATPLPIADSVEVHKAARRLDLMRGGKVLRSYHIALGLEPTGSKERAGDFRTPEGHYLLTRRNPRSDYFLSIQVSYPNEADRRRARRNGWDPGGSIMLHGRPNLMRRPVNYYASSDWTDGCIALSDSDMVEVWLMTRDNTPIDIEP